MTGCTICGKPAYAKGLCYICYHRKWYQANKDKISAAHRKYYQVNREKVNAANRKWQQANKDKVNAACRKYYQVNRDKINAAHRNRPPSASQLVNDFQEYEHHLFARTKPAKRKQLQEKEAELKRLFVESVDAVIDGGTELQVAKKLNVDYKKNGEMNAK